MLQALGLEGFVSLDCGAQEAASEIVSGCRGSIEIMAPWKVPCLLGVGWGVGAGVRTEAVTRLALEQGLQEC